MGAHICVTSKVAHKSLHSLCLWIILFSFATLLKQIPLHVSLVVLVVLALYCLLLLRCFQAPRWTSFCYKFLPVERDVFLPTVAKSVPIVGHLIVGIFSNIIGSYNNIKSPRGYCCFELVLYKYLISLIFPHSILFPFSPLAAMIGLLYPCIDSRLGEPHKFKREWSSVMRCVAVFVGINHASAVSLERWYFFIFSLFFNNFPLYTTRVDFKSSIQDVSKAQSFTFNSRKFVFNDLLGRWWSCTLCKRVFKCIVEHSAWSLTSACIRKWILPTMFSCLWLWQLFPLACGGHSIAPAAASVWESALPFWVRWPPSSWFTTEFSSKLLKH